MNCKLTHRPSARPVGGFTIVEIVIGFIIIGILTLIMVPTLARRADDAKITAAQKDVENLKDAMERVAIDTGYAVRIYALNDGNGGDGVLNYSPLDVINGLEDEKLTAGFYNNMYRIFINTTTGDFAPDTVQVVMLDRLITTETDYRTPVQWRGPYVNWQRDINGNDWPDDPWGNDYLFFSSQGILYPTNPQSTDPTVGQDHSYEFFEFGPRLGTAQAPDARVFDRFCILSMGPNGLPGDGSNDVTNGRYGHGDDVFVKFGGS